MLASLGLYRAFFDMRSLDALSRQELLLLKGFPLMPQHAPYGEPLSPQTVLADALLRTRTAHGMVLTDPNRAILLDQAERQLLPFADARPRWGEYWAIRAYISALRDGERSVSTIAQMSRSYVETPYLRKTAEWRTGYALRHFTLLKPDIQAIAVREAVWLSRSDYDGAEKVKAMIRNSEAYRPFMIEWLASRSLDADFTPVKGLAPQ